MEKFFLSMLAEASQGEEISPKLKEMLDNYLRDLILSGNETEMQEMILAKVRLNPENESLFLQTYGPDSFLNKIYKEFIGCNSEKKMRLPQVKDGASVPWMFGDYLLEDGTIALPSAKLPAKAIGIMIDEERYILLSSLRQKPLSWNKAREWCLKSEASLPDEMTNQKILEQYETLTASVLRLTNGSPLLDCIRMHECQILNTQMESFQHWTNQENRLYCTPSFEQHQTETYYGEAKFFAIKKLKPKSSRSYLQPQPEYNLFPASGDLVLPGKRFMKPALVPEEKVLGIVLDESYCVIPDTLLLDNDAAVKSYEDALALCSEAEAFLPNFELGMKLKRTEELLAKSALWLNRKSFNTLWPVTIWLAAEPGMRIHKCLFMPAGKVCLEEPFSGFVALKKY